MTMPVPPLGAPPTCHHPILHWLTERRQWLTELAILVGIVWGVVSTVATKTEVQALRQDVQLLAAAKPYLETLPELNQIAPRLKDLELELDSLKQRLTVLERGESLAPVIQRTLDFLEQKGSAHAQPVTP